MASRNAQPRRSARRVRVAALLPLALAVAGVSATSDLPEEYSRWTRGFDGLPPTSKFHDHSLRVEGKLPSWLVGTVVRVGPGGFETRFDYELPHWWDGFGLLHSFKLDGGSGTIRYSHQFIDSDFHKDYANRTTPAAGAREPQKHTQRSPPRDELRSVNTLVTVRKVHGKFLTNTETTWSNAFDLGSLDTLQAPLVWDDAHMQPMWPSPAHEHTDVRTGVQYNYQAEFHPTPGYRMFSIAPGTQKRKFSPHLILPARGNFMVPFWSHSFGMSERFLILSEPPVLLPRGETPNCGACVNWRSMQMVPGLPLYHRVLDKVTGEELFWFTSDAAVPVHHINAYEDRQHNTLVVDLLANKDAGFLPLFYVDSMRDPARHQALHDMLHTTRALRYVLPLNRSGAHVTPTSLLPPGPSLPVEMPRISYGRYNMRPYRFFYGTGVQFSDRRSNFVFETIYKIDVAAGTRLAFHEPMLYCQEPLFVPRRAGTKEDDGVVIATCSDHSGAARSVSMVVVLDAKTMKLLARATAPVQVPYGFHGNFYFSRGESDVEAAIEDRAAEKARARLEAGAAGPRDARAACLEACGERFVGEVAHCEIKRDTCSGRRGDGASCGRVEVECLEWARMDSEGCEAECVRG